MTDFKSNTRHCDIISENYSILNSGECKIYDKDVKDIFLAEYHLFQNVAASLENDRMGYRYKSMR